MSYEKNFQIGVKASPDEVIRLRPEGPPSKLEGVGPEVKFRRAVAIVPERAKEWDLGPGKLGMIGFPAGAFLVADVAVDPRAAPLAFVAPTYGGETLGRPVPADAPPLFTVMAQDDVLYRLAEGLYADWTDAERSAEMHIYQRGNHGFGMVKQGLPSDRWVNLFHE